MGTDLNPLIRDLFKRIIDSRNIMSLFKYQRLDSKAAPVFIQAAALPCQAQEIIKKMIPCCYYLYPGTHGDKSRHAEPTLIETSCIRITQFYGRREKPFEPNRSWITCGVAR
jgi:hypothetical protein